MMHIYKFENDTSNALNLLVLLLIHEINKLDVNSYTIFFKQFSFFFNLTHVDNPLIVFVTYLGKNIDMD